MIIFVKPYIINPWPAPPNPSLLPESLPPWLTRHACACSTSWPAAKSASAILLKSCTRASPRSRAISPICAKPASPSARREGKWMHYRIHTTRPTSAGRCFHPRRHARFLAHRQADASRRRQTRSRLLRAAAPDPPRWRTDAFPRRSITVIQASDSLLDPRLPGNWLNSAIFRYACLRAA